ncbi:MAG: response regulator [Armatimonadota bacterium]
MRLNRSLRVLVIDDHAGFCETIESLLESAGCAVDVALTPYAGVALSDTTRYDLVLIDYRMPQLDGVELLPLLAPRGHRCMLIVSGASDQVPRERALATGAQGILPKPIDLERLFGIAEYVARDTTSAPLELPQSLVECSGLPAFLHPVFG